MVIEFKQLVPSSPSKKWYPIIVKSSHISRVALSACLGLCFVLGSTETEAQSPAYGDHFGANWGAHLEYFGDNGEGANENRKSRKITPLNGIPDILKHLEEGGVVVYNPYLGESSPNNPSLTETGNLIRYLENGGEVQYNPHTEASDSGSSNSESSDEAGDNDGKSIYEEDPLARVLDDFRALFEELKGHGPLTLEKLKDLSKKIDEIIDIIGDELDPTQEKNFADYVFAVYDYQEGTYNRNVSVMRRQMIRRLTEYYAERIRKSEERLGVSIEADPEGMAKAFEQKLYEFIRSLSPEFMDLWYDLYAENE